jgi:G3E family GTPase
MEAIPALVVTGPLGSGKTTVIARLLAGKPAHENWVVLLNEFSDAGIDALTVASAARGAYDVRLVPGGCLCCAGEQDFRRNLRELVDEVRPDRIIVEPSGLGHPAGIVEELLACEARGQLRLETVLAVIDAARVGAGAVERGTLAYDQAEIADALALTKADLADADVRARFAALASRFFPAKRWTGEVAGGELPPEAMALPSSSPRAAPGVRPALHEAERNGGHRVAPAHRHAHDRDHDHDHGQDLDPEPAEESLVAGGRRAEFSHLGHVAARWIFPRSVEFSRARLAGEIGAALHGEPSLCTAVRIKGVFRVAEDAYALVQLDGRQLDVAPSAWRRDSRVEVLVPVAPAVGWADWDALWRRCQSSA